MDGDEFPGIWFRFILGFILIAISGLSATPHTIEQARQKAQQAIISGNPREASQQMAKVAKFYSRRPDLWEMAGSYALQAGDSMAAVQYLVQAARLAPSGENYELLGKAYLQAGDRLSAIDSWKKAVQTSEIAVYLYPRLLSTQMEVKDYAGAVASLNAMSMSHPENALLHYRKGLLLASIQPEEALAPLELAAKLDVKLAKSAAALREGILKATQANDQAYIFTSNGQILAALGEWDLAREAFENAIQTRPDYAEAWAYLGEALQHQKSGEVTDKNQTLETLQKAVELDPTSLTANSFLGIYWQRQKDFPQALHYLQIASNLDTQNPALLSEIANTLALSGDLQKAYQTYQKAVDLAPRDATYVHILAEFSLIYEYAIPEIALPAARRAVIRNPSDPANLDLMAQVMTKLGDRVSAARFIYRALEIDPLNVPARLHLGFLYLLDGQYDAARQEFDLINQLAPESVSAEQAQRLIDAYFP